ncbi:MAG TPA: hypothetical protein DDW27_01375 [Bacteroidales bacterium]|nr:hypothetical protein [Bacteroidales bacterium]
MTSVKGYKNLTYILFLCTFIWHSNLTATNETGFPSLPGGCKHPSIYNGKFAGSGEATDWWSSIENTSTPEYVYHYYIDI